VVAEDRRVSRAGQHTIVTNSEVSHSVLATSDAFTTPQSVCWGLPYRQWL